MSSKHSDDARKLRRLWATMLTPRPAIMSLTRRRGEADRQPAADLPRALAAILHQRFVVNANGSGSESAHKLAQQVSEPKVRHGRRVLKRKEASSSPAAIRRSSSLRCGRVRVGARQVQEVWARHRACWVGVGCWRGGVKGSVSLVGAMGRSFDDESGIIENGTVQWGYSGR